MKFIDGLYFGPKAEHNKKELVRKLKKEKYLPGLWLITLPHNEGNILDMVEARLQATQKTLDLLSKTRDGYMRQLFI